MRNSIHLKWVKFKLIWNVSYSGFVSLFVSKYFIVHKLILTAIFSLSLIQLGQVVVSNIVVSTSVPIMCWTRWIPGPRHLLENHQAVGILKKYWYRPHPVENHKASQPAFSVGLSFSVESEFSVDHLQAKRHSNGLFAGETSKRPNYGLGLPDQLGPHMSSTF